MLKKRLMGVVTVRQELAVQSFGYRRYLPLGRPEVLVENLDRWGSDEIVLQCIDRSRRGGGPDLGLLDRIARLGLSTPLIYAGGIGSVEDGVAAIKAGADRICIDALLRDAPALVRQLAKRLGAQALIGVLPLSVETDGLRWLDYRNGQSTPLSGEILDLLAEGVISEALVVDWRHEGMPAAFDVRLLEQFPVNGIPLLAFGGLSDAELLGKVLQMPQVAAAAIGNFLNYREHAVHQYKLQLAGVPLRMPSPERTVSNQA